jgi:hypothetical protein
VAREPVGRVAEKPCADGGRHNIADNIDITPGSGRTVATDEVGTVNYQQVKLTDGTLNSSAVIPGDATSGLFTNPKRSIIRVQQTPTVSTSPAYTSGDQLGGLMTIANAARVSGNGGLIRGIALLNKGNVAAFDLDLLFFTQTVTTAADNAAATFSDTDMESLVGFAQIDTTDFLAAFAGTPANYVMSIPNVNSAAGTTQRASSLEIPYTCAATSLFCAAIVRGTPTLAGTSDLVFSFIVERY